jgi:hypothetical protein
MSAPADECESEASLIEGRIAKVTTDRVNVGQIADIVAEVWNSQFGPSTLKISTSAAKHFLPSRVRS